MISKIPDVHSKSMTTYHIHHNENQTSCKRKYIFIGLLLIAANHYLTNVEFGSLPAVTTLRLWCDTPIELFQYYSTDQYYCKYIAVYMRTGTLGSILGMLCIIHGVMWSDRFPFLFSFLWRKLNVISPFNNWRCRFLQNRPIHLEFDTFFFNCL